MKKNIPNSDKISENHISGINRVVKLDIVVNGNLIKHFKHFRLQQSAKTHHNFELTLAHDSLDEIQNHNLEQAQQFFGKRLTVTFKYKDAESESPERTFVGVVTKVAFSQDKMSLGNIVLKGHSPTILMDSAPHTQSFGGSQSVNTSIIADSIIKETLGTTQFDFRIDTQNKSYINYSAQYCETHYNYLTRIAEAYGEQFYSDGEVLHFGKLPPHEKPIQLIYGSNVNDVEVELKAVHIKPEYFGYNSSSHAKMLGTNDSIKHLGELSAKSYELNNSIFKTRSLTPTPLNPNMFLDIEDAQKSARGSAAVEVFTVSGNTSVPFLYIGCVADLAMRKPDSNQTSHFTTLMITEATHEVDSRGYYTGSFEAIAEGTGFMPKPDFVMPKAEPQVATVISNIDPLNQGRVQVQFDWQLNDTTHFIRMMSPDAGGTDAISQNRGFVAIPEIGDQVMVGFEYHNPDFPFAMGGMFHGNIALGGGVNNHLKSIQTRSGIKVLMNDAERSVTIEDPSGNVYFMDGQGNINVTAPNKITMNATDIQMNAYNNLEMNVSNNLIINAMSKFFVFTPYMKNVVSGFMSFFSGKALFNSSGTLDIEAKEAKLHGTEKTIIHSDKQAIINSKGTAEMYGESGNQLSNQAKKISTTPPEQIAKAIVYFRPKTGWNGEYGFDWLREKDNGLAPADDPAYADTIESGYKDGVTDLIGGVTGTAYTQLKAQYKNIPISRKPLPAGSAAPATPSSTEYFVPFLTLFSKEFVDKIPATITNKPKFIAELNVLIEIDEDIDKLEFEYDKKLFTISKPILSDKTKTVGLVNSADSTIIITCLKDLTSDKEIKIYAYAKGSKQPLVDRKLAGKILVLKNDTTVRKEEKFVLISIWTDVSGSGGIIKGSFTTQEKENFENTFYQALTIPVIEEGSSIILDVSSNSDYQIGGKFIDSATNLILEDTPNFFSETQSLFLNAKDTTGNLINVKYSGYFTVFSLAAQVYDGAKGQIASNEVTIGGRTKTVFLKNLIIFPNKDFYTMNHEGLHGFNLVHTHRDTTPIDEPNAKYIFPSSDVDFNKSTTNVMCYRDVAYSTWRWQWHIINSNISEK